MRINYPETDIESNELKVKITDSFINEMSVNREVSALGFLRGDGWGIVSSVLRKNRTGNTQISGKFAEGTQTKQRCISLYNMDPQLGTEPK